MKTPTETFLYDEPTATVGARVWVAEKFWYGSVGSVLLEMSNGGNGLCKRNGQWMIFFEFDEPENEGAIAFLEAQGFKVAAPN